VPRFAYGVAPGDRHHQPQPEATGDLAGFAEKAGSRAAYHPEFFPFGIGCLLQQAAGRRRPLFTTSPNSPSCHPQRQGQTPPAAPASKTAN